MQENGKDSRKVVRDAQWNGGNLCENHKTISEKQEGTKKNRKAGKQKNREAEEPKGKNEVPQQASSVPAAVSLR